MVVGRLAMKFLLLYCDLRHNILFINKQPAAVHLGNAIVVRYFSPPSSETHCEKVLLR